MGFSASSSNIRLDGSTLVCDAKNREGQAKEARLDLNNYIGNSDGWFQWEGENFADSAKNLALVSRDGELWLEAELTKRDGSYREKQGIKLDDRIHNDDGNLYFD